ncbi:cAMP-mediated signaling protein sok1, partial [Spiromyces aspiralis]
MASTPSGSNSSARLAPAQPITAAPPATGSWNRGALPPINRHTLRELDIKNILHNPKLRHEIAFEAKLEFRPNPSPEMARYKESLSRFYWRQLDKECRAAAAATRGFRSGMGSHPSLNAWLVELIVEAREILYEMLSDPEAERGVGRELRSTLRSAELRDEFTHSVRRLPHIIEYLLDTMAKLALPPLRPALRHVRQL